MKITLALFPVFILAGAYVWVALNIARGAMGAHKYTNAARKIGVAIEVTVFACFAAWFGWGVVYLSQIGR